MQLSKKLMRRVHYKVRCWQIRWQDWRTPSSIIQFAYAEGAISLDFLGCLASSSDANNSSKISSLINTRHVCILSDKAKNIIDNNPTRKAIIHHLAHELPNELVKQYVPIEWHTDFHSGWRWNPNLFYLDIPIAPILGADIKTPRELSRFQHVNALAIDSLEYSCEEFLLQILDWISANPVRRGVNWACTMDVALRAINWIWGLKFFAAKIMKYPQTLQVITYSIYQHGIHIEANLDYYEECTGNHYLSDIAGLLYISALFPQFPQANRWLLFSLQQLVSEMERVVYPDGGSHEGSTHYHRLVAELFVSCAALTERISVERRKQLLQVDFAQHKVSPFLIPFEQCQLNLNLPGQLLPSGFYEKLARMAEFTVALTKPNGLMPQFGDNDSGRAHKLLPNKLCEDIRDHAHIPAVIGELLGREDLKIAGLKAHQEAIIVAGGLNGAIKTPPPHINLANKNLFFPYSGMAVLRSGPAWLGITCGPNGLQGRGGHNHNDKLSFELNIHGYDFIVDGGCPVYTSAPNVRNNYRSTWAHSTIAVVKEEQDNLPVGIAGLFKLPEKSNPRLNLTDDGLVIGSHTGYGAKHERQFCLTEHSLSITDTLPLNKERWLIFNLDPTVTVAELVIKAQAIYWKLVHQSGLVMQVEVEGGDMALIGEGYFSLGYGVPVSTSNVKVRLNADKITTKMEWYHD